MTTSKLSIRPSRIALAFALAFGASLAMAATPYPTHRTPAAQDVGVVSAAPLTVTVALKLRNQADLDKLIASLYTAGSPGFHQFLSPAQFHERFSPSQATIDEATAYFTKAGLSVKVGAGHLLKVTGPSAAIQKAFKVSLHQYEVQSAGAAPAYRFRSPVGTPSIASASVAANVAGIIGLDNRPRYAPMSMHAASSLHRTMPAAKTAAAGNPPGEWTVADLAKYYNVTPLYNQGIHGEGHTIAIVTLASFTPSDAFTYWSSVGLTVDPNRLSVVDVDGGPGAPSDVSGSDETTLDVEQSGGVAPAAKIIVYQSANTDQGFVDAFAQAIDDNTAETISASWGGWEWFAETLAPVTSPRSGTSVDQMQAFNSLFVQAAAQGQSMFASQGDNGAYEVNRFNPSPEFSNTLSVGAPASSPWITSAGGTTLPVTLTFNGPTGPFPITIPTEQAWGWSYLTPLCAALGYDPISCGIFAGGTGGGVSSYNKLPSYQKGLSGIRVTEAGQSFIDYTVSPPMDYVDLPAGYAGRNVPDVSMNADPYTGYIFDYTSDQSGFGVYDQEGGTSFVAPQLNGITALIGQKAGGRVGLLNFPLYALAKKGGYAGAHAPLRDIVAGDNWFYSGVPGYDAATGVGTIDVANLARVLSAR